MEVPVLLKKYVSKLEIPAIGKEDTGIELKQDEDGVISMGITAFLERPVKIGEWHCSVRPAFTPTFYYTPHLTPTNQHVIDMHVFRTPVIMLGDAERVLCVLPDADGWTNQECRLYLDLNAETNEIRFGMTTTQTKEHTLYVQTGEAVLPAGEVHLGIRFMLLKGKETQNPYRPVLAWYWKHYGHVQQRQLAPCGKLEAYVRHTYEWAFDRWKDIVWQEFELDGVKVGAPQFIVITKQSPNYQRDYGPCSIRESKSIWNQAWFSSMRSAIGLYRYGKMTGNEDYIQKARMTKELALHMPQKDGLFFSVIAVPTEEFEQDGKLFSRGADWRQAYFGNSDRNPSGTDLRNAPYHLLDMSWTALQMLEWYESIEKDDRLLRYVMRYADRLLSLQDEKGYFPAWINQENIPREELKQSAESAVSASMLLKLYQLTGNEVCKNAAVRCAETLMKEVAAESRWEDFETYWSCSRFGSEMQGKKYKRNQMYKQCSLSPFYLAQMFLDCFGVTEDRKYLQMGERCLDEMLMFQSSFQPDYMPITTIGGFGVMNADAELNDQRQALFSSLIVRYGRLLNRQEYIERGTAALRASFSMMYCPENPEVRLQWEQKWPFLNELDFGFMMENYGHNGYADGKSVGIGEFTIYDWGNGAASAAVMEMRRIVPELFE